MQGRAINAVIAAACVLLFVLCLAWLRRAAPPASRASRA